jgi:hypothetical protein
MTNQPKNKRCPFCETYMTKYPDLLFLVGFENPSKVIASTGMPIVSYVCPQCGFVATFSAELLGIVKR